MLLPYRQAETRGKLFGAKLAGLIAPDGRVFADFRLASTAAGRMSCGGPNLQQVPRERRFRDLVVASPGYLYVIADYSQIEMRAAVDYAREPTMLGLLADPGADLHRHTIHLLYGIPEDEVSKEQRQGAKTFNFGLIYSMGPETLRVKLAVEPGHPDHAGGGAAALGPLVRRLPRLPPLAPGAARGGRGRARGAHRPGAPAALRPRPRPPRRGLQPPGPGHCGEGLYRALALVRRRLREAGLDAVPVIACHDEIVFEAREDHAAEAARVLEGACATGCSRCCRTCRRSGSSMRRSAVVGRTRSERALRRRPAPPARPLDGADDGAGRPPAGRGAARRREFAADPRAGKGQAIDGEGTGAGLGQGAADGADGGDLARGSRYMTGLLVKELPPRDDGPEARRQRRPPFPGRRKSDHDGDRDARDRARREAPPGPQGPLRGGDEQRRVGDAALAPRATGPFDLDPCTPECGMPWPTAAVMLDQAGGRAGHALAEGVAALSLTRLTRAGRPCPGSRGCPATGPGSRCCRFSPGPAPDLCPQLWTTPSAGSGELMCERHQGTDDVRRLPSTPISDNSSGELALGTGIWRRRGHDALHHGHQLGVGRQRGHALARVHVGQVDHAAQGCCRDLGQRLTTPFLGRIRGRAGDHRRRCLGQPKAPLQTGCHLHVRPSAATRAASASFASTAASRASKSPLSISLATNASTLPTDSRPGPASRPERPAGRASPPPPAPARGCRAGRRGAGPARPCRSTPYRLSTVHLTPPIMPDLCMMTSIKVVSIAITETMGRPQRSALSRMSRAPRCGARTRSGSPCRSPAVRGKARCRMYGGARGSDGQPGNRNALKHGFYATKMVELRRQVRELLRDAGDLIEEAG